MKNTLADINNILFEQMERLNDDDLTETAVNLARLIIRLNKKRKKRQI